jgi:N-methylhydantoinase A/oxoprolinase/acetone carboxylase beta subunit
LVAYDYNNHRVVFTNTPTSYGNFVDGVLDPWHDALINTLIRRKGAKSAMVMTHDFRDVLEIAQPARSVRPALPARRSAHSARATVRGRGVHRQQGEIITPPDAEALATMADKLKLLGVEAVAVFFMNS